jgi:hypothetical protein
MCNDMFVCAGWSLRVRLGAVSCVCVGADAFLRVCVVPSFVGLLSGCRPQGAA